MVITSTTSTFSPGVVLTMNVPRCAGRGDGALDAQTDRIREVTAPGPDGRIADRRTVNSDGDGDGFEGACVLLRLLMMTATTATSAMLEAQNMMMKIAGSWRKNR
jgi:hypothetical protein